MESSTFSYFPNLSDPNVATTTVGNMLNEVDSVANTLRSRKKDNANTKAIKVRIKILESIANLLNASLEAATDECSELRSQVSDAESQLSTLKDSIDES